MPDSFNNGTFYNTVSGVENVTAKKGKGKKIAIISGVSAAAVIGGGVALYNFSPLVKNQIKLRTMKPDKYYAWVYEENSQDLAKKVSDRYRVMLDEYNNGTSSSVSLKYTISDDAKDYALDKLYEEFEGSDEELEKIENIINNFSSAEIGMHAANKSGAANGSAFIKYNGSNLVSADYAADLDAQEYFFRIPELTEKWIGLTLENTISDQLDDDEYEVYNKVKDMIRDPGKYLTPEELEDMIVRYVGIWTESVDGVKLKQDEEIKIAGMKVKYTAVSVKLNQEQALEIAKKYVEEVQDDGVIRNIVIDELGVDSDLYDEAFDEVIDELDEALDDYDEDEDTGELKFTTYIDAKGVIRGFDFKVYEDGETDGELFAAMGKDGDKVRGEVTMYEGDEAVFTAELKATEGKKETYSGSIDFTADDTTISVDFDDYKVVDEEKGYFNCDLSIDLSELDEDIDPIKLRFESDGSSQNISYDIRYDDTDFGTVTLSYSYDKNVSVDVPDSSDAYMIDLSEPDFDITKYVSEQEVSDFIWNILMDIGLDEDTADEFADEAASEMFDELEYELDRIAG